VLFGVRIVRSFRQWTPEFRGRSGPRVHCATVCESNNSPAPGISEVPHLSTPHVFVEWGCRTVGDQKGLYSGEGEVIRPA
jgi:hypothetical protein